MRRFLECLVPVTACNLKCSYCYVIQQNRRNTVKANFRYSPEYIGKALSLKRLGGISYISICGAGETLIVPELPDVVTEILKQGHFVNITTNGTLTDNIKNILIATEGMHDRLHFAISFHYIELLNRGLLDTFFSNIQLIKNSGCSFVLQINLVDEYIPYWNDIKEISLKNVGAYPQVAVTRDESFPKIKIRTDHSEEEYFRIGQEMASPLFEYTFKNFGVKRNEFCYAGLWSATLNLCTGEMTGCYGKGVHQNIFENLTKDIIWKPIGKNCCSQYCINSSHFMSQGIIPRQISDTYAGLRNRPEAGWYKPRMEDFLDKQFKDTNTVHSKFWERMISLEYWLSRKAHSYFNRIKK